MVDVFTSPSTFVVDVFTSLFRTIGPLAFPWSPKAEGTLGYLTLDRLSSILY